MLTMKNKALFLDRDGVINIDFGYVHKKEDFVFIDGIFEIVAFASSQGYKIIIATNQAGIGRGFYNESQFNELTFWMIKEFNKRGCKIDRVYFSPYHPEAGIGVYKEDHYSRKPNPGMLLQAKDDFDLDLSKSFIIGDRESDMIAGAKAGVGNLILLSQNKIAKEHEKLLNDCIVITELKSFFGVMKKKIS